MRIIVLSGSPLALPVLNDLHQQKNLSALICPEDMIATEVTPLQNWATTKGVPCWQTGPQNLDAELDELIRETKPRLVIVFGFPYTLAPELLKTVPYGGWNIHFSLQPENRGTITIHQLVRGLGQQLLHQQNIALSPESDAGTALQQLSILSTALLHEVLVKVRPVKKQKLFPAFPDNPILN
jgi:methionyl-tRNA formyltransferase